MIVSDGCIKQCASLSEDERPEDYILDYNQTMVGNMVVNDFEELPHDIEDKFPASVQWFARFANPFDSLGLEEFDFQALQKSTLQRKINERTRRIIIWLARGGAECPESTMCYLDLF